MPAPPRLSVVMAVYNGQRFLQEVLDSILRQSFGDFEFIVIDDGSTDATADILSRAAVADERVRTISRGPRSPSRIGRGHEFIDGLNEGCAAARAAYIARMDADDVAEPNRFEAQMDFLSRKPNVAAIGSAIRLMREDGTLLGISRFPLDDADVKRELALAHNPFANPTVVLRKDAFEQAGRYRRAYRETEDFDLWLRLAERFEVANLAEPLLRYRIHSGQQSFGKLRAQIAAKLAAIAAAGFRARGLVDPTDNAIELSPQVIQQLGLTESEIDHGVQLEVSSRITSAVYEGLEDLAASIASDVGNKAIRPADVDMAFARGFWARGSRLKGLASFARAILHRPALFARLIPTVARKLRIA